MHQAKCFSFSCRADPSLERRPHPHPSFSPPHSSSLPSSPSSPTVLRSKDLTCVCWTNKSLQGFGTCPCDSLSSTVLKLRKGNFSLLLTTRFSFYQQLREERALWSVIGSFYWKWSEQQQIMSVWRIFSITKNFFCQICRQIIVLIPKWWTQRFVNVSAAMVSCDKNINRKQDECVASTTSICFFFLIKSN